MARSFVGYQMGKLTEIEGNPVRQVHIQRS